MPRPPVAGEKNVKNTQAQKVVGIVRPQAIKDDTEFVGSKGSTPVTVDAAEFDQMDIYVMFGAMDIKMATMKLYESDTDFSAAAVTGADFGSPDILPTSDDDNHLFAWHVDLSNGARKRYYQIELIPGNGSAGTYAVAWAVLSRAKQAPNTAAERGLTAELFV